MADMIELIMQLPKIELHMHIEGSLEPELMFKLAQRNNIAIDYSDVNAVKEAYQFDNLQSFLDIYYQAAKVLVTEQDFYDLAWAYFEKCAEHNVVHAEIFFDPQTHTSRNITFECLISGLTRAKQDALHKFGISSHFIMCFLRHLSEESAFHVLEQALPYKDAIIGIGLDSSEVDNPPSKFERVFKKAKEQGYRLVAHAGEEGSSEYIWQALNLLNVERIDHGVRCLEDKALVAYLRKHKIPLTVCPNSNIQLKVFEEMQKHNLPLLINEELVVTVNSDDPAYFGGYLTDNLIALYQAELLNKTALIKVIANSIEACFLSEERKSELRFCLLNLN